MHALETARRGRLASGQRRRNSVTDHPVHLGGVDGPLVGVGEALTAGAFAVGWSICRYMPVRVATAWWLPPAVIVASGWVEDPAGNDRSVELKELTDRYQTELVEAAERRQIKGSAGSKSGHVEVLWTCGVSTFILEDPYKLVAASIRCSSGKGRGHSAIAGSREPSG